MNKYKDILDQFAGYIDYDPGQKSFNLMTSAYDFHKVGKMIETLLSDYDPTGTLAVIYAKYAFENLAKQYGYSFKLCELLESDRIMQDMERDIAMHALLSSEPVSRAEAAFFKTITEAVRDSADEKLIGNIDEKEEKRAFFTCLQTVIENLGKCGLDVYSAARPISKIGKFSVKPRVFHQMADCLLAMDNAEEGVYLCYIDQFGTDESYFAFLMKSGGTVIAVHDRANEAFIGQHERSRSGRWRETHNGGIFPYEAIRSKDGDTLTLEPESTRKVLFAMILLAEKFNGYMPDTEPVILNTLIRRNYAADHAENSLVPYSNSALAKYSREYVPEFTNEDILSGEYSAVFDKHGSFPASAQFWVDRYGDGFVYDPSALLASAGTHNLTDKDTDIPAEFIGNKSRMDMEAYRQIRIQLAKYIRQKQMEEYDAFGGTDAVSAWWLDICRKKKEKLISYACAHVYGKEHPDTAAETENTNENAGFTGFYDRFANVADPIDERITYTEKNVIGSYAFHYTPFGNCINADYKAGTWNDVFLDEENGCKCNVFFIFHFRNWLEVREFAETNVPLIVEGWNEDGRICYNGNRLLSATDAVADIESPLCGKGRPDGGEYKKMYFNVALAFSKRRWKKLYASYCKGHAT